MALNEQQDQALNTTYIITDKDTGVQYLYFFRGDSGGITPLLNSDGTPMLNKE